jgi:hypothetical protein
MENTNLSQLTQQTSMQSTAKKWYQHKGIISIVILAVIAAVAICIFLRSKQNFVSADQAMNYIYNGDVNSVVDTHIGFTIHLKNGGGSDSGWYQIKPSDDGKFSGLFFSCGDKCKGISYGQE